MSLRADLKPAFRSTWLTVSVLMAIVAAAPFVARAEFLGSLFPPCPAKARGSSCLLCGMTTAWSFIGRGDFSSAVQANAGSVPLWTGSVLNFVVAVAYSITMLRRRRHRF